MRPAARRAVGPLRRFGTGPNSGFALNQEAWPPAPLPQEAPRRGAIQVWAIDLDVAPERIAALATLLSAEELERAWRFREPVDRLRFVVGRGTLRRLLGACLQKEARGIRFQQAEFGKPALAQERGIPALRFNAAGSDSVALIALSANLEVGVDLERVRDDPELVTLARRLVTSAAATAIEAAPLDDQARLFLEHWVQHEALAKASGLGLRQIQAAEGVMKLLAPPRAGYVAAVAATSPFDHVECCSLAA